MTSRVGMVRAGIGWCLLSGVMVGMPIAAARFVTSEGTPRAACVVGDAMMVDLKELWRLRELNDEHPLIRCSTTPSDPPGMIFPLPRDGGTDGADPVLRPPPPAKGD